MHVVLIGSTGLIGEHLLNQLIRRKDYTEIDTWVKTSSGILDQRFTEKVIGFDDIPEIPVITADFLFCCLGTTLKKAKTREVFRKVDVDYVVDLAKLAERSGIKTFLVISSVGASARSASFYLRTKGEMEEAVRRCVIPSVYILRPSILLGKRHEKRPAETIGKFLALLISPFLLGSLRKYRPIHARTVARAMIRCALESKPGLHLVESDEIQRLANQ